MSRVKELLKNLDSATNERSENVTPEQLDSVDWSGLNAEIKKRFKKTVKLTVNQGQYVRLESPDLSKDTGILASTYKWFRLEGTNVVMVSDGTLHVSMAFQWQYKNGGSNGVNIFSAWYDFDKSSWVFRDAS
jgi:hypothetical protein